MDRERSLDQVGGAAVAPLSLSKSSSALRTSLAEAAYRAFLSEVCKPVRRPTAVSSSTLSAETSRKRACSFLKSAMSRTALAGRPDVDHCFHMDFSLRWLSHHGFGTPVFYLLSLAIVLYLARISHLWDWFI